MNAPFHTTYILGSLLAAILAAAGVMIEAPLLYGIVPGIIGAAMALTASIRFFRRKVDLAGFVSTVCGFIFYQAFQANPVMLPEFTGAIFSVPQQDQLVGIALANLTCALLLLSFLIISKSLPGVVAQFVPSPARVTRDRCDGLILGAFWVLFAAVALPNVLFGKVVVGAIKNILYQRMTWGDAETYSGFEIWGGPLGSSVGNLGLWATSLFLVWIYLLGSRHRLIMWLLGPLIVLWTASVVLQGSRTYLVTVAFALLVYFFGNPKFGLKAIYHALWALPAVFLAIQITTHFRGSGLQAVNLPELTARLLEIRGNEGASSQMDGLEYYRTELVARELAPNPVVGLFRGLLERPYEGLLMPIPRSLFPWKSEDVTGRDFNLFYQNVRLGVASNETFLGASPGLIGRELIKYGIFGPLTLFFWMGLILAIAHRLVEVGACSDFHRIFAALLMAFFVAQSRDFVPVWFVPFLPAGLIFCFVARWARRRLPVRARARPMVAAPLVELPR